ncbi:MAG: NADH-ubiquinone oxidoreductase-F iron-sulfur binding region domain-containing protein [Patescibacteria group bacterium]|nr:NADH-ubiquinone oxidoreductase-F iron-sulfur binding region domain-containing protein [Patescibacteria group bacterium]
MTQTNLISKIKQAQLCGRSGSGFPTGLKWEFVKQATSKTKYVICNASEGEPNVFKDKYLLENYPQEIINGIKLALKTVGAQQAYIYLNHDYYKLFKNKLTKLIGKNKIELFKKQGGYIAGEESVAIKNIQGDYLTPEEKPPYPTQSGLYGCPTLINNVETFYAVSQIYQDKYNHTRFYSLSGDLPNPGVYEFDEKLSIKKILEQTNNYPKFDFFIKAGGGAIGSILLPKELKQPVLGSGAIIIYNKKKTDAFKLMHEWSQFLLQGNCDKCVPCREGLYRINELIENKNLDLKVWQDILNTMQLSSLCPLGQCAPQTFYDLIHKIILK